jgi:hypothetical protein
MLVLCIQYTDPMLTALFPCHIEETRQNPPPPVSTGTESPPSFSTRKYTEPLLVSLPESSQNPHLVFQQESAQNIYLVFYKNTRKKTESLSSFSTGKCAESLPSFCTRKYT